MKIERAYFANGVERAVDELADEVIRLTKGTGAYGGVIGLSGGIDSTATAYLCDYAFGREGSGLGLYGIVMPSDANRDEDKEDGLRVAKNLGIESVVVPIEPIADIFARQVPGIDSEFHRGNLYSELRAVVLSRVAASKNYRVMGTGNWDEDYVLGYCTKRGDAAVDNNILGNLPKRLVRELAAHLGVSEDLVNRVPTAGLWEGQTDEGELGYTYDAAELIQNGFDQGYSASQIEEITGFDNRIISDVVMRHANTEHKRKVPSVGKVSLLYGVRE
ncbi:NAD(+) synthase [archaeon]|jgi:NAD+ synthase|nr:NAD(+) synthase [archaeon]MBT7128482.1 NAD(+) synthase [archaeon]